MASPNTSFCKECLSVKIEICLQIKTNKKQETNMIFATLIDDIRPPEKTFVILLSQLEKKYRLSFEIFLSLFPCHYLCFSHFFPSSAYGLYALKPFILFWLDSCIPLVCWPLGPSMERVTSHLSTASYVSIEVSHTLHWHEINCNQIRI